MENFVKGLHINVKFLPDTVDWFPKKQDSLLPNYPYIDIIGTPKSFNGLNTSKNVIPVCPNPTRLKVFYMPNL